MSGSSDGRTDAPHPRRNRTGEVRRLADMRTPLVLLVAVLLLSAACGNGAGSPSPTASPEPVDATGAWQLTDGTSAGQPLPMVDDARITLIVEGSSVGGQSACNQYMGELTVIDGAVRVGGLGGTDMGCDPAVMESEMVYLQALGSVTGARMDGDVLVLLGPGVELRYERLEPPPTAELIGTRWLLDGLVQGDAVASTIGDPATLVLNADGSFEGTTGCRTLTGRYAVVGDEIEFVEMTADGECAGGPADQDAHVVEVLGDGFRAHIDGEQMTIVSDGGLGLVYRVVAPTE